MTQEDSLQILKEVCLTKEQTIFQDSFSEQIWETTYKDHKDNNIDDTMFRVASAIASAEVTPELQLEWTEKFYDMLTNFKVVAGGRILSNAGTEWNGTTLANCFVSPRGNYDIDSLVGILKDLENQAITLKSEGGWGTNFSYVRPRGAFINGIGVESPGSIKYMELFDKSSEIITAGSGKKTTNKKAKGKIRKGAMMAILDVSHPDIVEFITAKQQPGRLTKFNMSVNCTDDFMKRVVRIQEIDQLSKQGYYVDFSLERAILDKWDLIFPNTTHPNYKSDWTGDIKLWQSKGFPVVVYSTISTTKLWDLIMESTFTRAEPGIVFLDRANHFNPLNYAETISATNPCGEQTLAPGGICCLGTLNLTQFLNKTTDGFDLDKLSKYVKILVRFLDNVNTYSAAPLPEYKDSMTKKRRMGCGVMGWGSSLFMMKIPFGGDKADTLRKELMMCYAKSAYEASIDLAVERGMFEYCIPIKHSEGVFIQQLGLSSDYMDKLRSTGIRNSSLLSQQPNGNSSILANIVSGGIEPIFMPEYNRTVIISATPEHIIDVTPNWSEGAWHETELFKSTTEGDDQLLKGIDEFGTTYKIDKNRGLTKEVLCEDYGVRFLKQNNEWDSTAEWAKTTTELTVTNHVSDLKGFAQYTDSACSKTVNLPFDYPYEDFKNLYLDVYKTGYIKGFTTYRSGTLMTVLSAKEEKLADKADEEIILLDVKLPDSSPATVKTLNSEGRKWYVTCVWSDDMTRPLALFVHTNSSEKNITTLGAVDQLLALAKRKGIPDKHIDETLCKISGDNNTTKIARMISLNLRHGVLLKNIVAALDCVDGVTVVSFLFQIKKFLSSFIKDGEVAVGEVCPECGGHNVVYESGCKICRNCGNSKCG